MQGSELRFPVLIFSFPPRQAWRPQLERRRTEFSRSRIVRQRRSSIAEHRIGKSHVLRIDLGASKALLKRGLAGGTTGTAGCQIASDFSVEMQHARPKIGASPISWRSATVRVALGLVLAVCLVQAARETVASFFAAKKSIDGFARSARWDGSNPESPARSARMLAERGRDADGREIARAFEDATRLGAHRAENWTGLGEALDLTGDSLGGGRRLPARARAFPALAGHKLGVREFPAALGRHGKRAGAAAHGDRE